MSDYGDYSDDGEDWFYVEDEYMPADDLAEHAVASPPPTSFADEDMQPDWDRFDYFNDLEYASDGYDNATFEIHSTKDAKVGTKRKREVKKMRSRKKRAGNTASGEVIALTEHSPIIWRAQTDREIKTVALDDDTPSYALLKNWREKLGDTPPWARASAKSPAAASIQDQDTSIFASAPISPPPDIDADPDGDEEEAGIDISQDALMAALQRQLAAAGGPLSGMDPQQLLEFALRMAADKDAGDDIAGEMANAMLEGDDEDDDADAEENLLAWVAQQRNANNDVPAKDPKTVKMSSTSARPPTPPSSEANRSIHGSKTSTTAAQSATTKPSLKRKAGETLDGEKSSKTAKSQARAAPAKVTRASRAKP